MNKPLTLLAITLFSSSLLYGQETIDSAGNIISAPATQQVITTTTTITTPAPAQVTPPPPPPAPAQAAPVVVETVAPVSYDTDPRPTINVNRLRFGAFVAPTISWMKPTASTDDQNKFNVESGGTRVGFIYGLMVDYNFAPNYGIITGIQINQTGGNIVATNKDQSIQSDKVMSADFTYRLQYLEIPLALKLRTDEISGFRFFGQLGASVGFNIGKKADYEVRSVRENATAAYDTSGSKIKLTGSLGHIAPLMFQMNIGAGMEYPFSNRLTAYLGLFFNNGFAPDATKPNLFDEGKLGYAGEFRDANTRLNNFAIRVGLFF